MQPSRAYIDQLIQLPGVRDFNEHQQFLGLNRWTFYVVAGLMIARAGGTLGNSRASSRTFSAGPSV